MRYKSEAFVVTNTINDELYHSVKMRSYWIYYIYMIIELSVVHVLAIKGEKLFVV